MTEAYCAVARKLAPHIDFSAVTGRFGARIVTTDAENIIAGHAALDIVADHTPGPDALILAISFDTALSALRSLLSVPVVGITEAALRAATQDTRAVGVVFFGEVSRPLYEALFTRYGVDPIGWEAIEIGSTSEYLSAHSRDDALVRACERLAAAGAAAVVLCGAAIVGVAARVRERVRCEVYDGAEAVPFAVTEIQKMQRWHRPVRALPPLSSTIGLSPSLARLLSGQGR